MVLTRLGENHTRKSACSWDSLPSYSKDITNKTAVDKQISFYYYQPLHNNSIHSYIINVHITYH
jgi:hypothetical protein